MISVILCTHNPDAGRLMRTLTGLRDQSLPASQWECLVVDNASSPALDLGLFAGSNFRIVREPVPGLTHARRRGLKEATGNICVLVDDDNVLSPDYLAQAIRLASLHPQVGAFGGRSLPEFETPPANWTREFFGLLALRDLGATAIITPSENPLRNYPLCAPIGAGMVLRKEAVRTWIDQPGNGLTDRTGRELTSGGDNDIVLTLFRAGWSVAYFPELSLTHLIPTARISPEYLARLNRGIQKSWMQVLSFHNINDWPAIPAWTVPPRKLKAWFTQRAWSSVPARIRWQGICGHFDGRRS